MTVFIGDVHGKFRRYKELLKEHSGTIQVGDMGVGFINPDTELYSSNPPYDHMIAGNHRFIRGNHDSPKACLNHSQCISDGHIENDVMFIGGALSIDRVFRTEGYDWWADEELSVAELTALVDQYIERKPKVMVTHDCPEEVAKALAGVANYSEKLEFKSRTRQAFQSMFSAHSPDVWVFGHWHVSADFIANGTRFVCLAELEAKDIETGLDN